MVMIYNFMVILLFLFHTSLVELSCDFETVVTNQCSNHEMCVPLNGSRIGHCRCMPGFTKINDTCTNVTNTKNSSIPKSSSLITEDEGGGHGLVLAAILVPIALITLVIFGVYFSRKYNILVFLRIKFYQRNNNYDEVMIGQDLDDDDPPLR